MSFIAKRTGGYARQSAEAQNNAREIYNYLYSCGWSLTAVAAFLGNVEAESEYNPWRWEGDRVLVSTDPAIDTSTVNGYGLGQFTPAGKYIHDYNARHMRGYAPNFADRAGSPSDGYAQLQFIDEYADYYQTASYPVSYAAFKAAEATSTRNIEWWTRCWFANYERGTWFDSRARAAEYWYEYLGGHPPQPIKWGIPIWLLFKMKEGGKP